MPRNPQFDEAAPRKGPGSLPAVRALFAAACCLLVAGCAREAIRPTEPILPSPVAPKVDPPPLSIDELVVQVRPDANPDAVWQDHDLVAEEVLPDGVTFRTRPIGGGSLGDLMEELRVDYRVAHVEPNGPVTTPTLPQSAMAFNEGFLVPGEFFDQALAVRLNLDAAHTACKGAGIKVAILDTGVDRDHPALARRILPESYDFVDRDADPSDRPDWFDNDADGEMDEAAGHGTHVAGLVSLVAPSAGLLALRVLDSDGQGNSYAVASAIEYAVDQGARVVNLSIRLDGTSVGVDRAITYARERGVILITAAGNGAGTVVPDYPASDPRVWAIAAVDRFNQPTGFTSRFPGVVLSAPGENLLSAFWDGGYAVWSGTSMAAPLVAGTAALLLAGDGALTGAQVLARLQASASGLFGDATGMGPGVLDPGAALGTAEPLPRLEIESAWTSPSH